MKHRKYAAFIAAVMMIGTGMTANVSAACTTPQIMTTAEISSKLPAPKGIKAVVKGNSVTISWKKVSGAKKYKVYYYDIKAKKYKLYTSTSSESCTLKGLSAGMYYFRVCAAGGQTSARIDVTIGGKVNKNWVNLYKEAAKNADSDDVMFSLQDITGDGIPELFISAGDAHVCGAKIGTVSGNKVKFFTFYGEYGLYDEFGGWGTALYSKKKNVIVSSYTQGGYSGGTVYSFEGGDMKEVISFEDNAGAVDPVNDSDKIYYKINGKKVSENEYNSTISEYKDDLISLGRDYTLEQLLAVLDKY